MPSLVIFAVILGLLVTSVSVERICRNKACVNIAKKYLSNMDTSVDPCDDFYKFACGKYAFNNPIPEDADSVSEYSKPEDLVNYQLIKVLKQPIQKNEAKPFRDLKKFYKLCMNTKKLETIGLNEVMKILETLGGWPVVKDLNPDISWESVLYGLRKKNLESNALISLRYETADLDLVISSPHDNSQAAVKNGKSDETVKKYYDFMVQIAMAFGAEPVTAKQDMDLVLDFEIYLANKLKPPTDIKFYTIEQLEMTFPGFRWSDYMKIFIPKSFNFDSNTKMQLSEPEYVSSLIEVLKITPARVLRNYIIWIAIRNVLPLLNKKVRDLKLKFVSTAKPLPRSKECVGVIGLYDIIINAFYIRKYFNKVSKTKELEVVSFIRDQFEQTLNNTNWSEPDKAKAIDKIKGLDAYVGFTDELFNDEKLHSHFKNVDIHEDSLLQTWLDLRNVLMEYEIKYSYEPINKIKWTLISKFFIHANAYYFEELNAIVIPAAILQGNFFNVNFPSYINFGAIGYTIAHEMSHGFDVNGRQYNKDGDLEKFWSDLAEQDFAEKMNCIINQFNNFTILGKKINGNLTQGENFADLSGLKISYLSYQTWKSHHKEEASLPGLNYTNNQLFWIVSANEYCSNDKREFIIQLIETDSHAPNKFRVNGPISNLEMFSKDFNCPIGSNMNAKKKCNPW